MGNGVTCAAKCLALVRVGTKRVRAAFQELGIQPLSAAIESGKPQRHTAEAAA